MRAWPSDASVAHLIFTDHQHLPSRDELDDAIAHAIRKGARAIRTSAMFPGAADVVLADGFDVIDRLALLAFDLDTELPELRGEVQLGRLRPWHLTPCSQIDRESFGLLWGNSATSLRDIRHATPSSSSRVARSNDGIIGFAISGAAGDHGYLQRLAVRPDARRRGAGHDLVVDALRWMQRRSADQALVNTGVTNDAALSLYRSLGFVDLTDELVIAERRLT
ncbi:acetyltransferase (GNAT) family protein [Ilumatobacter fluminis]|uniref:Acetyltransferase (GNAT) family protein n=2 Tax=Ilumatobacter fluminis TaxID=467091 RepID=A0A4R7I4S6_9ACTN|nr:acetyltransferase (GNAT) family protein [Ilumatobacter fluminis]